MRGTLLAGMCMVPMLAYAGPREDALALLDSNPQALVGFNQLMEVDCKSARIALGTEGDLGDGMGSAVRLQFIMATDRYPVTRDAIRILSVCSAHPDYTIREAILSVAR